MTNRVFLSRYLLVVAAVCAISFSNAQEAPNTASSDSAKASDQSPFKLDQLVVTASPGGKVTELSSSFDVSVLPHTDIVNTTAAGVAGLLDSVPGFYGESSGGEVNQNLSVDGLRPSFYGNISLQEDGLPTWYNGFFSEFQMRPDSTYGRVEVVRNGPSAVFAPEAAAAIVNFITRMPSTDEGDATFSVTSEGNKRVDFFYGGPIPNLKGWSAAVGGYYEIGQGERPVGYNMTNGGQVRATIQKDFEGGSFSVSYKHIDAWTAFYLPMPAAEDSNGNLSSLLGFNLKDDTLYSPELRNGTLRPPTGYGNVAPMNQDGQLDQTDQVTAKFDKTIFERVTLSNSLRLANVHYEDHDDRSAGNAALTTAPNFLQQAQQTLANYALGLPGAPAVTRVELVRVSDGSNTVIADPATLNGNGLLLQSDDFYYHADFHNIIDDLHVTWKTDANTLTVGAIYEDIDGKNLGETGNTLLIDVRNHAHAYDVVGLNASGQVVDHLTDNGVLQFDDNNSGFYGNGNEEVKSSNYYVADSYQVTHQLRLDGGFRYENVDFSTLAENWVFGAPLPITAASPTIIADQATGSYGNGTFASGSNNANDYAWSFGANFLLTDRLSFFARTTKDYSTGVQDFNVFGGENGNPSRSGFATIRFQQGGIRYENPQFAVSATGFYGLSTHSSLSVTLASGLPTNVFINYESKGVDFEAVWKPMRSFDIAVSGVVQHADLFNIPPGALAGGVTNGNQVDRLPDVQIRIKPTYYFKGGSLYLVETYYGQRYGDLANTEKLGAYSNLGAGISFDVTPYLTVAVVGDNLLNELAFTEGNPRGNSNLNAGNVGYVLARPIWGRNAKVSCTLHF